MKRSRSCSSLHRSGGRRTWRRVGLCTYGATGSVWSERSRERVRSRPARRGRFRIILGFFARTLAICPQASSTFGRRCAAIRCRCRCPGSFKCCRSCWDATPRRITEYRRSLDLSGDREMVEHLVLHRLWARGEPFRAQFRRYLDLTQTKPAPILEDIYQVCEDAPRALEKLRGAAGAPEYQSPAGSSDLGLVARGLRRRRHRRSTRCGAVMSTSTS